MSDEPGQKEGGPGRGYGDWVCLEWDDGPITEIAKVVFDDGHELVEVRTKGGWVGEGSRIGADGKRYFDNHMRFSRDELVAMLDLIDGKPVKGFFDE